MATHVGVIGASEADAYELGAAEAVGEGLAHAGAVLFCGGLGGVMEAACRGARRAGGLTVGLLPGTDRSAANEHVTVAVATGIGELRNGLLVRAVDALVAIGGGHGTLSEIGLALRAGVPLVGLSTWRLQRPDGAAETAVIACETPEEAVRRALELARR